MRGKARPRRPSLRLTAPKGVSLEEGRGKDAANSEVLGDGTSRQQWIAVPYSSHSLMSIGCGYSFLVLSHLLPLHLLGSMVGLCLCLCAFQNSFPCELQL